MSRICVHIMVHIDFQANFHRLSEFLSSRVFLVIRYYYRLEFILLFANNKKEKKKNFFHG